MLPFVKQLNISSTTNTSAYVDQKQPASSSYTLQYVQRCSTFRRKYCDHLEIKKENYRRDVLEIG